MLKKRSYSSDPVRPINQWVRDALDFGALSNAEIGRIFHERGLIGTEDRSLAGKMATFRDVSAAEMMLLAELTGYPPPPTEHADEHIHTVSIVGHVGAGAVVEEDFEQVPEGGLEQIEVPFPLPADMIAFEVRGDSMLPMYDPGSVLIVYREQRQPLHDYYGRRVIVRTDTGRRYIKTIIKGEGEFVSLISWNSSPIENVVVTWIGEIFTVFPAEQVRKIGRQIARQGGVQGQLRLKAG